MYLQHDDEYELEVSVPTAQDSDQSTILCDVFLCTHTHSLPRYGQRISIARINWLREQCNPTHRYLVYQRRHPIAAPIMLLFQKQPQASIHLYLYRFNSPSGAQENLRRWSIFSRSRKGSLPIDSST